MAGVVLRFSGRIQAFRLALACFSGPMEAETSVRPVTALDREPKSAFSASAIASA